MLNNESILGYWPTWVVRATRLTQAQTTTYCKSIQAHSGSTPKVTAGLVQHTEWWTSGIMITIDLPSRNEVTDELGRYKGQLYNEPTSRMNDSDFER
jgi:hypothetical protein